MNESGIRITASPHVRSAESTARIMWSVVFSLVPVIAASTWFFGPSALLVLLASVAGCLLAERLFGPIRSSLADGSAMITGLLLGLTLPPGFPMWMAFLGGAFGIAFGKQAGMAVVGGQEHVEGGAVQDLRIELPGRSGTEAHFLPGGLPELFCDLLGDGAKVARDGHG